MQRQLSLQIKGLRHMQMNPSCNRTHSKAPEQRQTSMHSEKYILWKGLLCGAILSMLTFSVIASDAEKVRLFENNKSQILKADAIVCNGIVFATGKMRSKAGNTNIGYSKAKLDAFSKISLFFEQKINWPEKITPVLRKKIWAEYLKCQQFHFSVEKSEVVYKNSDGEKFTLVIAVPESNVSAQIPDFNTIHNTLLLPENYRSGKIRLNVCIELCENNIPADLLTEYGKKIAAEYGFNVGQVVLGKNAATFLCRDDSDITQQPIHTLLQRLNKSPYDPEICFYIGKQLENDGLKYNAQLFWQRGAIAKSYNPEFATKCKSLLMRPEAAREMLVLPEMLFVSSAGNTYFESDALAFLNFYTGMLPVGLNETPKDKNFHAGQNSFKSNNLTEAYHLFTASAADCITFQACNMAGNAGRRIGKIHEATALLLQATIADPLSVYPWVHLAWIYRKLNLKEQENFCIEKIKTYKLDDWSSKQLKLLEK